MNVERKAPQVLDLSRSGRSGPVLEIAASEASELVASLFLLTGDCEFETYDLPTETLEAVHAGIPADLKASLDELGAGSEVMAQLVGLVAELDGPRDVPALLAHVEAKPALEIQMMLLGYYQHPHPEAPPDLIQRAAGGDEAAGEELKRAAEGHPDWLPELTNLLGLGADRVKALLQEILPAWYRDVWPKLGVDMAELKDDAAAKRAQITKLPLEQLIETATNGYQFTPDPITRRILLFPSVILRPWLVHLDHKDLKVICYPMAESAAEGGAMTPHQLARFYKALGDEGRLKLLKRLGQGPLSLMEAAEFLGVAKSTAHHHLGLLRHAGLVLIREENNDKTWSLRRDLLPQAGEILNAFLG